MEVSLFFKEHTRGSSHMVKEPVGGVVASANFLTVKKSNGFEKIITLEKQFQLY